MQEVDIHLLEVAQANAASLTTLMVSTRT